MKGFIGRKYELQKLEELYRLDRASLVVVKGRRRIGKSRLIEEFAKNKRFLPFTGLAPVDPLSAQDQRDAFARQFTQNLGLPPLTFQDWSDAFNHLSLNLPKKPTVILFDEISWMGSKDATFIPKLKAWWDQMVQHSPHTILILCGSVSTWIEENIINSTAFFGRISAQISLNELSLPECAQFLEVAGFKSSVYDIYKVLSVIGGVPWYLEQILPHYTTDENIRRLCFEKDGILTTEFDRIFHDLFHRRGPAYKKIVHILADGMKNLAEIRSLLNYTQSGSLSDVMKNLIASGFVTQHYSWSFKTKCIGKRSLYRLSDNYIRFFIKYIEPNIAKIAAQNTYKDLSLGNLPAWEAMMGFQIESLLLKNRAQVLKSLGLQATDIVADNPYIQKATGNQRGCQIDYLIQTSTQNLFICEFKFKRRELGLEIIDEMKEKLARFATPKGFGKIPVLLHLGGVSDAVHETKYFYRIIDIADYFEDYT